MRWQMLIRYSVTQDLPGRNSRGRNLLEEAVTAMYGILVTQPQSFTTPHLGGLLFRAEARRPDLTQRCTTGSSTSTNAAAESR